MIELAPGWSLEVDRGPDWLFLRVAGQAQQPLTELPLAETAWNLMEQHFAKRIVVELDDTPFLFSQLLGELVLLQKRVSSGGGMLRLCGLSQQAQESLQTTRLNEMFPCFGDRGEAVMGRPRQPR